MKRLTRTAFDYFIVHAHFGCNALVLIPDYFHNISRDSHELKMAVMANIVFINSVYKRKLIEIFPEGLGTPTYCMISSSQNIKHYSYVGKSIRTFQSNYSNILVNEKEFLDLAKKII